MEYKWLFAIWIIALVISVIYAIVSAVLREVDSEGSVSANVLFFGFLSVITLTTIATINTESKLKN